MDSFSTQKIKPKRTKFVAKKSRAQVLLNLFYRVIEITVVLVTVAKLCYQLIISLEGFDLAGSLINRHLAFLLGNAIVIAIIAKCGFLLNQEPDERRRNNDFYDDFVRESSRGRRNLETQLIYRANQIEAESQTKQSTEEANRGKQSSEDKKQSMLENRTKQSTEETNRGKQSMLENKTKQSTDDKKAENTEKQNSGEERMNKVITLKRHKQKAAQNQESPMKSYIRSRSENHEGSNKSTCGKLRRSETERSTDEFVSDDELRYKIESFIARQRRNQKDEEFCII